MGSLGKAEEGADGVAGLAVNKHDVALKVGCACGRCDLFTDNQIRDIVRRSNNIAETCEVLGRVVVQSETPRTGTGRS